MTRCSLISLLVAVNTLVVTVSGEVDVTKFVNMYIGTSYWKNVSDNHDYGNNMLNVGLPFSHSPWTAQSRHNENKCESPYYYFDKNWQGLRRSHWMSGSCVIDYGSASVLPSLSLDLNEALNFHALDHARESIRPYQYDVFLPESGIKVEATSKNSAGILRASLDAADEDAFFYLLFMASDTMYNQSTVSIPEGGANDTIILSSPVHRWYQSTGQPAGFSGHHFFKTSRPPLEVGIIGGYGAAVPNLREGKSSSAGPAVAYMKFDAAGGSVTVATGCSFVSPDKAEFNMKAELADFGNDCDALFDLEQHAAEVKAVWEEQLGQIQVTPSALEMASAQRREELHNNSVIFYTALWHALLLPRAVSDADGAYLSFTDTTRTVETTHPAEPTAALSFNTYYDDFSMWDIFRAQVPLLHLLLPSETIRDMLASLTVKAQQGHWLPIFPAWNSYTGEMVGDHCGVWVADAVQKGAINHTDPVVVGTAEAAGALFYILKNALMVPHSDYVYRQSRGRRALDSNLQYGYIPLEDPVLASPHPRQQVSRSLEYAFDDRVLLQLLRLVMQQSPENTEAQSLLEGIDWVTLLQSGVSKAPLLAGIDPSSPAVAIVDAILAQLSNSSANYRHLIDSTGVGFVRGKHANGTWAETDASFDPAVYYSWLTETNVWQYTWFVPHAVEDMITLYGGDAAFLSKLNAFFEEGWYNHGNEPDHHAAFLAAYASQRGQEASPGGAWQVQERVHSIIKSQYLADEQGLPGNEDAGQMSAWLVMSGLGLYQVCPGCGMQGPTEQQRVRGGGEYVLTTPLFDDVTLQLPARSGSDAVLLQIRVLGREDGDRDIYIQSLRINGVPHDCAFVSHAVVMQGGLWEYVVGAEPNSRWGQEGRACLYGQ